MLVNVFDAETAPGVLVAFMALIALIALRR